MTLLSVMGVAVPSTYERHQVVIARLTAFIAANYARPLYLAEFCVATGVPERTLRACCQAQLGMSPIRYLLLHRMRLARQALSAATPKTATVTAVATALGFFELGRFAAEYREMFGEAPLATLRRLSNKDLLPPRTQVLIAQCRDKVSADWHA